LKGFNDNLCLFSTDIPSTDFVEKIKGLYQTKLNDVRILIPIVNYLSKKEVITALPKFMKLNPQLMKDVFMRLLGLKSDSTKSLIPPSSESSEFPSNCFDFHPKSPSVTPTELLVALHTIDTQQVELKLIVKATSLCLAEKEVYTHEVLGVVMQQ
jgi:symplekin